MIYIDQWRTRKGLTQVQLRNRIPPNEHGQKIALSYLCDVIHGKRSPSVDVVERIAEGLGVNVGSLFRPPTPVAAPVAPDTTG